MTSMRRRRCRWRRNLARVPQIQRQIRAEFAELPRGSLLQFLLQPRASLGGLLPRTALLQGRFQEVLKVARGFVER